MGYDLHRLKEGGFLILGGVTIPFHNGVEAYSDGDVLLHAVIDALLGACGLRDIGFYFPPGQPEWAGISSRILLQKTMVMVKEAGFSIINLDSTIILEKPKLSSFIPAIIENLAADLRIGKEIVSVKAKTKEGLGEVGEGRAIEAYAVVLVENA
jgi:2-C-methyl-D-erythritol 2,4-cyclodiphosphate synthase